MTAFAAGAKLGPWLGWHVSSSPAFPITSRSAATAARYPDFAGLIAAGEDEALTKALRRAETIGRPLGDAVFLERLEGLTGRCLRPAKRGPKPKAKK